MKICAVCDDALDASAQLDEDNTITERPFRGVALRGAHEY